MRFLFVATLAALCVAAVLAAEAPKPKKSLDKPEKAVSADVPAKGEVKPSGGDASLTTANSPNPSSNGKGGSPKKPAEKEKDKKKCKKDKKDKKKCKKENKTKNEKKTNKGKKDDKKSTTTTHQKL